MSYPRLEELGGIQWPCPDEQHPGTLFLHARLWEEDPARRGAPAPFTPVEQEPPVDELSPKFPIRLTTGRRLRAGLAFMTLHFPDQVATNVLTLDAWDPKSGTAEFKATAIRVDKLPAPAPGADESQRTEVEA